jgi:hypothetical protein
MVMPRVKRRLPVFGSLLGVMLSMPFGSLWHAALRGAMMIRP